MANDAEAKILHQLEAWERNNIELPANLDAYRQLLRVQVEARARFGTPKPELAEGIVSTRLSQGSPLLAFEDLSLDWALVQSVLRAVSPLLVKDSPASKGADLSHIVGNAPLLKRVAKAWYEGSSLAPMAVSQGVSEELLNLAMAAALKPFLAAYRDAQLPLVNQTSWRCRYCPVCGGKPDFAYLDREGKARWLLCSRCDAEWLFQRLECPFCGTTDPADLAYYTDDQERYRLYVCERCRCYLKAIDLARAGEDVLLPLERVLTVDLDEQAEAYGYWPGRVVPPTELAES